MNKKARPFRVMAQTDGKYGDGTPIDKKPWCFGKYATREAAEQAITQKMTSRFWRKNYKMWIEFYGINAA